MRRLRSLVAGRIGVAMVSLLAIAAMAQVSFGQAGRGLGGPGGFGSEIVLLQVDQVQKELNLSDEQKQAVAKIGDEMRQKLQGSFGGLRDLSPQERQTKLAELRGKLEEAQKESSKKAEEVLKPEQKQRIKEISLQVRGGAALTDKDVAAELKLSDDQQKKLAQIREESDKSMGELISSLGGGDQQAAREKVIKLRGEVSEKQLAVLTPEQREQFTKMQGKKFDLDRSQLGPRRGPNN